MIWYNIKELENLLINGKLSDKTAFNYLFIHIILFTLAGYVPGGDDPVWTVWVHLLISLMAVIWGVRMTFEINRKGDNRDYFKRFISLSFVAAIRTLVVVLIISIFLAIANFVVEYYSDSSAQYALWREISTLFGFLLLNMVYFNILITSFRRINAAGENTGAVEVVN